MGDHPPPHISPSLDSSSSFPIYTPNTCKKLVSVFGMALPSEPIPPPPQTMNGRKALSNVVVRRFGQPGDLEAVRKTYILAMKEGRGSPFQTALQRFAYPQGLFGIFAGFVVFGAAKLLEEYPSPSPGFLQVLPQQVLEYIRPTLLKRIGQVVIASSALCGTYVFYARQLFTYLINTMTKQVLQDDLKDIVASYRLERKGEVNPNGEDSDVSCFWVAELDGKVVGSIGIYASKRGSNLGEVRRLFVHPSYQGRGIASRLMSELTSHARAHGVECLHLSTSDFNDVAVEMYSKSGWELEEKMPMWHMGLRASVVYMRKSIV